MGVHLWVYGCAGERAKRVRKRGTKVSRECMGELRKDKQVIVPWMTVPFLSSTVTVSFESFIRNLTSFMVALSWLWVNGKGRRKG
jgi:hypothetical protein